MPDITLSLSGAAATRLQNALAESKGVDPSEITVDSLKEYIVADLKQIIRTSEKRVAAAAAVSGVDPTIT